MTLTVYGNSILQILNILQQHTPQSHITHFQMYSTLLTFMKTKYTWKI